MTFDLPRDFDEAAFRARYGLTGDDYSIRRVEVWSDQQVIEISNMAQITDDPPIFDQLSPFKTADDYAGELIAMLAPSATQAQRDRMAAMLLRLIGRLQPERRTS